MKALKEALIITLMFAAIIGIGLFLLFDPVLPTWLEIAIPFVPFIFMAKEIAWK